MKKHFLVKGLLAILGLTLLACQNKEIDFIPLEEDGPVFHASMEQVAVQDTRVYADESLRLLWHADDRVSIFNKYTYNQQYRFDGETGDNSGSFTKVPSETFVTGNTLPAIYAVYPYDESTTITNDGEIRLTLPAEQAYSSLNFAPGANTMVSATEDNELLFQSIGGFLALKLYGDNVSVSTITLRGNKGEKLAGKAHVTAPLDGDPAVVMDEDATESIRINCTEPVIIGPAQDYYTEFWFVLPPTTFEEGFTITVTDQYGGIFEKTTVKPVTISRNHLSRMSPIEVQPDYKDRLAVEREALIALYNALDGEHWNDNRNWCSDNPVGEWYGIYVDSKGFVQTISLGGNNLNGTVSSDMFPFSALQGLYFENNPLMFEFSNSEPLFFNTLQIFNTRYCKAISTFPSWFFELPRLISLSMSTESIPSGLGSLSELFSLTLVTNPSPIPSDIGGLKKLEALQIEGFGEYNALDGKYYPISSNSGGIIPNTIGELKRLRTLSINLMNCEGTIPETIGQLERLEILNLASNNLSGPIPKEIGKLTRLTQLDLSRNKLEGALPDEICDLNNLGLFDLSSNRLSGQLPSGIGRILDSINLGNIWYGAFNISDNFFSGAIPESILSHPKWKYMWYGFLDSNYFDTQGISIPGPDIKGIDILGNEIDSDIVYPNNRLTILYQYCTRFGDNPMYYPNLSFVKDIYERYKDQSVSIIAWGEEAETVDEDIAFVHQYGLEEWTFLNAYQRPINGHTQFPANGYPYVTIVDSSGNVVFYQSRDLKSYSSLTNFMSEYLDGISDTHDLYQSTDYSRDGTVSRIMTCSSGDGIDVVLMGDGFTDRLIDDGTYENVINNAVDGLFAEEPFKSYQNRFNVYRIDVVSQNEVFNEFSTTALSGYLGGGTQCGGNNSNVIRYVLKAIPAERIDDALVIVMLNMDAYAGTCYMYNAPDGNYGRGLAIAYFPVNGDTEIFNGLVSHEAGGHGFAKLADEYAYEYFGAIPEESVKNARTHEGWGWYKNIDFTGDPEQVKWCRFINDERFASENIGCYEGAFTYWTGAWRPTENSIMNTNTGGFNAPSRYAIWYRINKLAYGESWNGTYEDFVEYDAINRTTAANARRRAKNYVEKPLPPLAPPVIVGHSWLDEMK